MPGHTRIGDDGWYANQPLSVVYDIFADVATRLGGEYVYLADNASNERERIYWESKLDEVEDQKRAVPPRDRAALVEQIKKWQDELASLRSE